MAVAPSTSPSAAPEWTKYTLSSRIPIMAAVMLGSLMQMIDSTIVNVAIPTMQGNLGATLDQIAWVSTGYILAMVIVLPMTGWLSFAFGRRKYLAASMLLFTAASCGCGFSRSLGMLVTFRIIQGIGGGALMTTAMATLWEIFPPAQIPMAQALVSVVTISGPAIGPVLGGWLLDAHSWPWIFFVNLPIGIIATVMTLTFLRDSGYQRHATRLDVFGIFLLVVGLGSLQTVLEKGTRDNWFESPLIVWLSSAAVVGVLTFIWWELRIRHPVVNLRTLRHRGFSAGAIFAVLVGFGLYGGIFVLPIFMQDLRGYTALEAGWIMAPSAMAAGVMMPVVGRLIHKFQARYLVALGVIGQVLTLYLFSRLTLDITTNDLLGILIFRGAANAVLFLPLSIATLIPLRGPEIAEGTGVYNLFRQLGGSVGIAWISTFLLHRENFHYDRLRAGLTVYNPALRQWLHSVQGGFLAHGTAPGLAHQQALAALAGNVQVQAAVLSYNDVFVMMALLFLCALPLIALFEKGGVHKRIQAPQGE